MDGQESLDESRARVRRQTMAHRAAAAAPASAAALPPPGAGESAPSRSRKLPRERSDKLMCPPSESAGNRALMATRGPPA